MASHIPRRRFHQIVFLLAGSYNVIWGLASSMDPQWLFRLAGMPPMTHPQIFQAMAMIVGIYGLLYFEIVRRPEHGWLLAAIGLLGKVLGPMGMFTLIGSGAWPVKAGILCLTNDLIWWIPFAVYLFDSWQPYRQTWGGRGEE